MFALNSFKNVLALRVAEAKALREQSGKNIQFYNCWQQANEDMYWQQFITSHGILDNSPEKTIAIFSVFGRRSLIQKVHTDVKVFYSGENLKTALRKEYADHCLGEHSIDLAMGFEELDDARYIRFPLWMDYMFDPWFTDDDIRRKCEALRHPVSGLENRKFCCMVASNEGDGLRRQMFESLNEIGKIDSAGRLFHNDDSLRDVFNNDKKSYISNYYFNICPENTDSEGYVTEKIFEAISCGCIPIYWGSRLHPEADILNLDAVILWNREDNGESAKEEIRKLISSPRILEEFMMQPRLKEGAEDRIITTFHKIENKFKQLIGEE